MMLNDTNDDNNDYGDKWFEMINDLKWYKW